MMQIKCSLLNLCFKYAYGLPFHQNVCADVYSMSSMYWSLYRTPYRHEAFHLYLRNKDGKKRTQKIYQILCSCVAINKNWSNWARFFVFLINQLRRRRQYDGIEQLINFTWQWLFKNNLNCHRYSIVWKFE